MMRNTQISATQGSFGGRQQRSIDILTCCGALNAAPIQHYLMTGDAVAPWQVSVDAQAASRHVKDSAASLAVEVVVVMGRFEVSLVARRLSRDRDGHDRAIRLEATNDSVDGRQAQKGHILLC